MSSYPLGYDAKGLAAVVVIFDIDGNEFKRYEMPQVVTNPIQEFSLTGLTIAMGINSNHGKIDIYIDDRDRQLIETVDSDIFSLFKAGFTIEIFLGKDSSSLNLWVLAVLQDIDLVYETGLFSQHLQCYGFGIRTQQRLSILKRSQIRESDGITPDETDTSTFISNLFKDTLTQTSHLAAPGLGQLDITVENVEEIAIAIPEYTKNIVSFGSILTELASMGYCYYGIDQNKKAFLFKRGEVDSGFLVSNDVTNTSIDTANWNPDKLMFFRNKPVTIHDMTSDSGYSILHFVGSQRLFVDHNEQAANADLQTGDAFHAFPFVPTTDNVAEISVALGTDTGNITGDLQIAIVGDNGGFPSLTNVRKSIVLTAAKLAEEVKNPLGFIIIKFDKIPVSHNEKLYVVLFKTTNAFGELVGNYQSGATGEYFVSSDGSDGTWTSFPGQPALITYNSKNVRIIGENTVTAQNLLTKEGIVNVPDTPNETTILAIAQAMLTAKSKIVRNFDPVDVSAPTLPPELGKTIRLIDVILGLDTIVDLIAYSLSIDATDDTNRGATTIKLTFQEQYS